MARPAHLAALLAAYADLGHASVAVPELLAAAGSQLRRQAAEDHERLVGSSGAVTDSSISSKSDGEGGGSGGGGGGGGSSGNTGPTASPAAAPGPLGPPSLAEVNSILASHLRLGYAPPPLLLQALQPGILRRLPAAAAADVAQHLRLLSLLEGYRPGPGALQLMLARVEAGGEARLPPQVVEQAQVDASRLRG